MKQVVAIDGPPRKSTIPSWLDRACRLVALSRSGYRYVRKKPNDDEIKAKLAQIAEDHHSWLFSKPGCRY